MARREDVRMSNPDFEKYQTIYRKGAGKEAVFYVQMWYDYDGNIDPDLTYTSAYCKKHGLGKFAKSSSGSSSGRSSSRSSSSSRSRSSSSSSSSYRSGSSRGGSRQMTDDEMRRRAYAEMMRRQYLKEVSAFRESVIRELKSSYSVRGCDAQDTVAVLSDLRKQMTYDKVRIASGEFSSECGNILMQEYYSHIRRLRRRREVRNAFRESPESMEMFKPMFRGAFFHGPLFLLLLIVGGVMAMGFAVAFLGDRKESTKGSSTNDFFEPSVSLEMVEAFERIDSLKHVAPEEIDMRDVMKAMRSSRKEMRKMLRSF